MGILESRIQEYVDHIATLKREIAISKENEKKLVQTLHDTKESLEEYIQKHMKIKNENKSLKANLKEVRIYNNNS